MGHIMQIPFIDSHGNHHLFRLAPGPIVEEDATTEAITPSALDGLDAYDSTDLRFWYRPRSPTRLCCSWRGG
jgi:hypothetical protein